MTANDAERLDAPGAWLRDTLGAALNARDAALGDWLRGRGAAD